MAAVHPRGPMLCWLLLSASALSACGGARDAREASSPEPTAGFEQPPPRPSMAVEGLMGTIPERKIHATLEPKLPRFQRCFFHGSEDVEFLAGHIQFYFRVGLDGRVEWVYPKDSSIGHRGTERCLLEEAAKARFPSPRGGGAAELAWGFELDGLGDARAPVAWDASRVAPVLERGRGELGQCPAGRYVVTVYVAPGGSVLGAGAAVDSQDAASGIDCVLDVVRGWHMPDPGSYAAKVTFTID